jgi:protein-S-isoprenylcysteine O-methyltransferase Ste14
VLQPNRQWLADTMAGAEYLEGAVTTSAPAECLPHAQYSTATTAVDLRRWRRLGLVAGNVAGAAFAGYLLLPTLRFVVQSGRPMIGLVFVVQQVWFAVVFLTRRAPRTVSHRPLDWIAAYAGWFTSFLVRPGGHHLGWAVMLGFWVQMAGLAFWAWAFFRLSRSFGIVPANRGLVRRGPYALVRHPLYSAFIVGCIGYLIQSPSLRNALLVLIAIGWEVVRIRCEERHLDGPEYAAYRREVPRRLCPGIW